ncbi:MAG: helix-turn-helix domain-containing protein [Parcubacteria group bacterium]
MEKLQNTLISYGLSTNEAKVYLAMVNFGHSTIVTIAKETEVKRPTVYLTIESLIKKELIKTIIKGKKKYYLPEEPERLLRILESKKRSIENILPDLKNNYFNKSEKPKVVSYEGKDGIRKIYEETIRSKTEVLWFGSMKDVMEEFRESYNKICQEESAYSKGSREIVNNTSFDRNYAKRTNDRKNSKFSVRVLPNAHLFSSVDNIIYDNKVAILSIKKNYYGVIIEDSDIANAYRTMFELAWKSAVK